MKNTHDLRIKEENFDVEVTDSENIEEKTIETYSEENSSTLDRLIEPLMNALSLEKQEDEKNETFTSRLLSESKKVLNF